MAIPQRSRTSANAEESASQPQDLDTAKFSATYMTWGRHLYNPDTDPTFYHRTLQQSFGPAGPALETALAASSRILPLVTATWCPSASNHEFWPEMFTPLQILPYTTRPLYTDNPAPHNVSAISPLDPQLFTTIGQHAENLVSSKVDARYNSSEVIAALESLVATSNNALAKARASAGTKARTPEFRRAEEDILILNGLGSYFANLFRAGLYYSIWQQSADSEDHVKAMAAYHKAAEAWAAMSSRAKSVYASDVSYGSTKWRRGNWADRLPAINADITALEKVIMVSNSQSSTNGASATQHALRSASRPTITATHTPAGSFHPGSEVSVSIEAPPAVTEAILWYRHVNHGERWRSTPMQHRDAPFTAAIPADYTNSPYPLQYYFELRTANAATLHPPFNSTWSNQPYYAIHKRT